MVKKTWKSLLAVTALLFGATASQAQDTPTLAVVSIAGYDNVLKSIGTLGEVAGKPGMDQMINALVTLQTGGRGLVGIDKAQPWGVQVAMGEFGPEPITFLPVTDLDALLGALAPTVGRAQDAGDDVKMLSGGQAPPMFVKQQGNWAFIAQEKEQLENLPADPVALLDGLHQEYTLAARVYVQNIPEPLRAMAIGQLREGFEGGIGERQPGETEEDFQLRRNAAESGLKQIERTINETDTLTFGWAVDAKTKQTYIDFAQTAVPGTMLAGQMAAYGPTTSEFGGFVKPGAAFSMHFNGESEVSETDQANLEVQFRGFRERALAELEQDRSLTPASKGVLQEAVGEIFDVLLETLKSGKLDAGAIVISDPSINLVAGGHVADGKKIEAALKKIGRVAADDPNAPEIHWDAETYKGYNFHHLSVPAPDADARRLLGDNLQIAAAASERGVLVAGGADAVAAIKQVLDASEDAAGREMPVAQIVLSLGEVMQIAARAQPDDPTVQMMAAMLGQMEGNDRVMVRASQKEAGVNWRISVDEGVIKLIGSVADGAAGGGGGDF